MAEAVVVRRAEPGDTPALFAIERASFSDPWPRHHLEEDDCLVAIYAGQIAGFLIWRGVCPPIGGQPAEYEILNLAVDLPFRRQGVASALLYEMLHRPGTFFLEVRESNRSARRLYQAFGFEEVGVRPKYYRQPSESAIVMRMKRC